jgi:neutral amino acid transport system permease protein
LRLSNFAHGDFMTLGAYITWVVNAQGINLWLAMLVGAAVTAIAMLIAERLLWKPMRDRLWICCSKSAIRAMTTQLCC